MFYMFNQSIIYMICILFDMRRKIVMNGPSSLTISLPSKWIKKNNLKKGDEVEIKENNVSLNILPINYEPKLKKKEISFVNLKKETRSDILLSLHKKGYDEIKVFFDKPCTVKEIHQFINNIGLGFEIVKQAENNLVLKNVSNPEYDQYQNLFRRIFRIALEYSDRILMLLKQSKKTVTESALMHEKSINRISNYLRRIINKGKIEFSHQDYYIIESICIIANNLNKIMQETREEMEIDDDAIQIYKSINNIFNDVYNLNYKFSIEKYEEIKNNVEEIKESLREIERYSPYIYYLDKILFKIERILKTILDIYS